MTEYVVRIRNSAKTKSGEPLTIDAVLKQIGEAGGMVIDEGSDKVALIRYEGTIPELYKALQYESQDLLISLVKEYEIPDTKKKIER